MHGRKKGGLVRRAVRRGKRLIARRRKDKKLRKAFHEIKHNPPKILASTREKYGPERARKQAIAIALSKAGVSRKK